MDLKTIYETNFTIFIGIFVTLAVMGTTTLYDKYKSKGGVPVDLKEFKSFSDLNQKITTFSSESLKHFSEYSKKLRGSIQNSFDSSRKSSISVQRDPSKNNPEKVEPIFLKAKDSIQKLVGNLRNKISSISSTLPRRNKNEDEKFVSLSDKKEQNKKEPYSKFSVTDNVNNPEKLVESKTDNVNNLEKIVESKKDELDFDEDLLTKMSTASTLKSKSPEANMADPFFGATSSEFDESLENNLLFDENESDIKIEGLDNEPEENNFLFNANSSEIKFGDKSDSLLASLKNDIVISKEKKVNFMGEIQGEDLDLKLMKSDLEGVLKDLKKHGRYSKS